MSATALKQRLREDLKAAMQAKAADEVRVLRALIAALDNAEAVPPETGPYVPRAFGDATAERPRRQLDEDAVGAARGRDRGSARGRGRLRPAPVRRGRRPAAGRGDAD